MCTVTFIPTKEGCIITSNRDEKIAREKAIPPQSYEINTKKIIVLVTLLVTLAVNYIANALPLNGNTTAAVSDLFPQYIVPLGYVFAIWGLIYFSLLGYSIHNFLYNKKDKAFIIDYKTTKKGKRN